MIAFPSSIRIPITNHLTGETCFVVRGDDVSQTKERLSEIVNICNEPEVYRWLFARVLVDQPYTTDKAMEWLLWTKEGWQANTHFCFITLDAQDSIVAACDIKSSDMDGAEVGYWASSSHRGVMTNTVSAVIHEAARAGFRSLMARAKHANVRSKGTLNRVGFLPDRVRRDELRDYFSISLV